MVENEKLIQAVLIQQKAFKLLEWLRKAMDKGFFAPKSAHLRMSSNEVTKEWLLEHIQNIPMECRPNIENKTELDAFCNYFSTYLTTTFEIIENPGERLYSVDAHCFCPMCSYFVSVSHLRPRKIGNKDKNRAKKLKVTALMQLCLDEKIDYPKDNFESLLTKENALFESVSIFSYTYQIIQRSKGISEGPALLALWREFAWTEQGSPKKKFEFNQMLAIEAKQEILAYLKG